MKKFVFLYRAALANAPLSLRAAHTLSFAEAARYERNKGIKAASARKIAQ
jgi:hypothetical protein